MTLIYVGGSFLSFLGIILLLVSFKNLNVSQKLGIILTAIGVAIPFLIGIINGFLNKNKKETFLCNFQKNII